MILNIEQVFLRDILVNAALEGKWGYAKLVLLISTTLSNDVAEEFLPTRILINHFLYSYHAEAFSSYVNENTNTILAIDDRDAIDAELNELRDYVNNYRNTKAEEVIQLFHDVMLEKGLGCEKLSQVQLSEANHPIFNEIFSDMLDPDFLEGAIIVEHPLCS